MAISDQAVTAVRRGRILTIPGNTAVQLMDVAERIAFITILDVTVQGGGTAWVTGSAHTTGTDGRGVPIFQTLQADNTNRLSVYWNGSAYTIKNSYAASHTVYILIEGAS